MSAAGEFIDAALQYEGDGYRAADVAERLGDGLRSYGSSVGAVRGTVRDALRKFRGLERDELAALASELWAVPVFERRLAAIVLLQSSVPVLRHTDLTRIEGFVRAGRVPELADPLATDVIGPLLERLDGTARTKAETVLDRWMQDEPWLRRAALLAPIRELGAGGGDVDRATRRLAVALDGLQRPAPIAVVEPAVERLRAVL
ncbi:DNA alkylation repair protein [Plantibacter flavus]|uniref:DNA alkylation repair protein n=1 Tax=Plantibacter flavus TaxID=150123 RepID=UPI0010C17EE8|nr:DNA alkylation repair protein [Plantibacter flavus]TKJ95857.1 DNA alkylation repair protein [Plantibacter flavus]